MDLFDEDEVTTADKINRPEPKQSVKEIELFNEFNIRNPKAGGGMLVQPSADGRRPGYAGKTIDRNIRLTETGNAYEVAVQRGPKIFNKTFRKENYKNAAEALNAAKKFRDQKEKIKKRKVGIQEPKYGSGLSQKEYMKIYNEATRELTESGKLAKERETKLKNFIGNKKKIKASVLKDFILDLGYSKYDPTRVTKKFPNLEIVKDLKQGTDFKPISDKEKTIIKNNFDLPEGETNWDFKKNRFGISSDKYSRLYAQIKSRLGDKTKYTIAANFSDPQGWMMSAMNRVYENELKNKVKFDDLTYQPIKNKSGIIIGFKDTTASGGNNTYYGLKKNMKEDATPWTAHGDFNKVDKFLKIANGVKEQPDKVLQKILKDKGIDKLFKTKTSLTLNDILSHQRYYGKLAETSPKALIKRQIVLHHTGGVGAGDNLARAAATKDIQLLTDAVNLKVIELEKIVQGTPTQAGRKLTNDEIAKLKSYGAKITDFDGKIVGGGSLVAERQFANIEKEALKYAKGDQFNVKTVASYLERLGCGKAAGGRVFYNEGAFGLTKCADKGRLKLENIITKGASNADDAILATKILQAGRGLKNMASIRGLLGPAALAFTVGTEAGLVGYDMLSKGETLRESFGNSLFNYALGKDYQIDPQEELFKRFKSLGYDDQQIDSIKRAFDTLNTINTGKNLATNFEQQFTDNVVSRGQPEEFMMDEDQFISDTAGQRAEQNLKDAQERLMAFNQSLKEVDRPGGMKKEDVLNEYFSSGKFAEDLELSTQAEKEANLQKLTSAGPKFLGSVFPKFEQQRQIDINKNLGVLVNPAFDIPGMKESTGGFLYGFADGGLSGGDKSGPPPESGPTPHGLPGILKRVKNI
jgi:hypothetical protein